jgi:phytoene dehydrogenase-like protein
MVDVEVVGSGPNGLAAGVVLARAGLSVRVHESAATIGGGSRTLPLMEEGAVHDVCSAVHPMALASEFFTSFELPAASVRHPEVSYAHPLDSGRAGVAYRSLERTVAELGVDGRAYRRLMQPLVDSRDGILALTLNHLLRIRRRTPVAAA